MKFVVVFPKEEKEVVFFLTLRIVVPLIIYSHTLRIGVHQLDHGQLGAGPSINWFKCKELLVYC